MVWKGLLDHGHLVYCWMTDARATDRPTLTLRIATHHRSGLLLDASHIEALAACTSLRALEITDPRTYAAAPNEAGAGAGAPPSAVCLRPLTSLTALTSFTYNKAATEAVMPHSLGLRSGLAR